MNLGNNLFSLSAVQKKSNTLDGLLVTTKLALSYTIKPRLIVQNLKLFNYNGFVDNLVQILYLTQ